jgi:hypothetical protein
MMKTISAIYLFHVSNLEKSFESHCGALFLNLNEKTTQKVGNQWSERKRESCVGLFRCSLLIRVDSCGHKFEKKGFGYRLN